MDHYSSEWNWFTVFPFRVSSNKVLHVVERYDPSSDTWTTLKSMNTPRTAFHIGVSCGKLFAFGGFDHWDNKCAVNYVEMYDPETNNWERRAPIPSEKAFCLPFIIPASVPTPSNWINGFRSLQLKDALLRGIVECGFTRPSEVQSECIPQALLGTDMIVQADSSTGKTSSLVISSLQQLNPVDGKVSILVLCPNREAALHIGNEYARFSKYLPEIKISAFVGDMSITSSPHIVIGTPTRILSLSQSGALDMDTIKHLIIDDCDKMINDLNMLCAVEKIFDSTSSNKQVLISTTKFPKELGKLCEKVMRSDHSNLNFRNE